MWIDATLNSSQFRASVGLNSWSIANIVISKLDPNTRVKATG